MGRKRKIKRVIEMFDCKCLYKGGFLRSNETKLCIQNVETDLIQKVGIKYCPFCGKNVVKYKEVLR